MNEQNDDEQTGKKRLSRTLDADKLERTQSKPAD